MVKSPSEVVDAMVANSGGVEPSAHDRSELERFAGYLMCKERRCQDVADGGSGRCNCGTCLDYEGDAP